MKGQPLFRRHPSNPILIAETWPYTVNAVFNPAAVLTRDGETLLLVRVEDRSGLSHFTLARSPDGIGDWVVDSRPTLEPDVSIAEESWGIEDPRITRIDDSYLIVYTGLSRHGPLIRLARTYDFEQFERIGTITPPEDKDGALFPGKFDGRYALLHRPVSSWAGGGAHIWISYSRDLVHWGEPKVLIESRGGGHWDQVKVGVGPPPLLTEHGWLVLFHGVKSTAAGSLYRVGLALLDLENPQVVLARSDEWVFGPEAPYERVGDVSGVVFPTGWVQAAGGVARVYYGATDSCVGVAQVDIQALIDFVRTHSL